MPGPTPARASQEALDRAAGGAPDGAGGPVEHVDVLIVGAGLSGIGAACRLALDHPQRSVAILEARDASGGTWDLFRYPGVRSDSDMFTLGYRFRPWTGDRALADGASILEYVRETAREHGVDRRIRYDHRVRSAHWSSADQQWRVVAEHDGHEVALKADVLWMCSGYYDYEQGYQPDFPGLDDYTGTFVHPQHWPEDLEVEGRPVVVIGSGATAVTLVPALAEQGARVTMLQRSPSYILSQPGRDAVAARLQRLLPGRVAYEAIRWRNVIQQTLLYQVARARPRMVRRWIRGMTEKMLPEGYDVDTHFNPRYDPWDQRLCLVPDGDLFRAIRQGRAEVVTDRIERFTRSGVLLESGRTLEADVVVSATGLNLLAFGGVELVVDGEKVDLPSTTAYRSMMLSDVPNFVFTVGYTNASWTLKADLVAEFTSRLLARLDRDGRRVFVPHRDDVGEQPLLDFAAGYVLRSIDEFPRQGDREPWRLRQNYLRDRIALRRSPVGDGALVLR